MTIDLSDNPILEIVKRTNVASQYLNIVSGNIRQQGVKAIALALEDSFDYILEANTLDLEMSREMAVSELMIDWLKLTPERLETTVKILKYLSKSADPTKRLINAPYQLESCQTYCQLMPLGTIALIYEAIPEIAAIAAGMCIKTGNSLVLRGCSTASNSNIAIAKIIQAALAETELPSGCIEVISSDLGTEIADLLVQDEYLDLIIPYGRPSFVQQIVEQATAPVLKTAIGNCYLYWSSSGDLELVRHLIIDSHKSEPDPVNAIEKVLINGNKKSSTLLSLFNSLREQGFKLKGDINLVEEFPEYLRLSSPSEWGQPYLDKTIAFRYINSLAEAVEWINSYSSGHADCLATESYEESRLFSRGVNSALVYINSSPRFSRHPNNGDAVFLGMSNQKGFRQGLIGLETFTTLKQIVQGEGC